MSFGIVAEPDVLTPDECRELWEGLEAHANNILAESGRAQPLEGACQHGGRRGMALFQFSRNQYELFKLNLTTFIAAAIENDVSAYRWSFSVGATGMTTLYYMSCYLDFETADGNRAFQTGTHPWNERPWRTNDPPEPAPDTSDSDAESDSDSDEQIDL